MIDKHPFHYQKPTEAETNVMKEVNDRFEDAYDTMIDLAPPSAELTLAIRKLQECRMWFNCAVVMNGVAS